MCRNIKLLYNFSPPATEDEVRASALQYVRKVTGMSKPSQQNQEAFDRAVDEVTAIATPRDRDDEAERARERGQKREAQLRARYGGT